mgnify:FL=1
MEDVRARMPIRAQEAGTVVLGRSRTSGSHGPRRDVAIEDVVIRGLAVAHVRVLAVVDEPRGVESLQAGGIHAVHEATCRVPQPCGPRRVARVVQGLTKGSSM